MKIIFDLDGTLIDSSDRMYGLFCELVPECTLSKEEYWEYKRNKVNHQMLLSMQYPNTNFESFNRKWMPKIEEESYIAMDKLYPDTIVVLETLKCKYKLNLLTARQCKDTLLRELENLGIKKYFSNIFTTEGVMTKEELLRISCQFDFELSDVNNYFVSDMGKDIQLGNKMGYTTVAISHGFMAEEKLLEYEPDYLIRELSELIVILEVNQSIDIPKP